MLTKYCLNDVASLVGDMLSSFVNSHNCPLHLRYYELIVPHDWSNVHKINGWNLIWLNTYHDGRRIMYLVRFKMTQINNKEALIVRVSLGNKIMQRIEILDSLQSRIGFKLRERK